MPFSPSFCLMFASLVWVIMESVNQRLWDAVHDDRMNDIRRLVEEEGADPTALGATESALHHACRRDRLAALRYFVEERKVDVRVRDRFERTLLHCACEVGSFEIVKLLVELGSIDMEATSEPSGSTALHYACFHSPSRVAMYLVEQGANVNARDKEERNALNHVFEKIFFVAFASEAGDEETFGDKLDLARFLIPRTLMRLDDLDKFFLWGSNLIPWDITEMLVTTYATQNLDVLSCYCRQFPFHTIFRVPFESDEALLAAIRHYSNCMSSRLLDSDGRLPIHVALESRSLSSNKAARAVTPQVILELLKVEPRSAFVQDPKSGLYPFEAAAACEVTASCERDDYEEEDALNLIYELFRCNPERLLKSRGVGHGICMAKWRFYESEGKTNDR